jgi:hypothetical protein
VAGVDAGKQSNVYLLGKSVYTTYLFPFEATAALLVIAVVGAVVLARRPPAVTDPTIDSPATDTDTDTGTDTGPGPVADRNDPQAGGSTPSTETPSTETPSTETVSASEEARS